MKGVHDTIPKGVANDHELKSRAGLAYLEGQIGPGLQRDSRLRQESLLADIQPDSLMPTLADSGPDDLVNAKLLFPTLPRIGFGLHRRLGEIRSNGCDTGHSCLSTELQKIFTCRILLSGEGFWVNLAVGILGFFWQGHILSRGGKTELPP